jgi:ATP/maltotriose-dependent transcriptional regulator MalT
VDYPVCWLSLDALDRDPYRFLNHFVASVQERFPRFGIPSRSLISSPGRGGPDSEQVLRTIVNDLYENVEEHFALVLDDFHLVEDSSEVSQFVSRFAQEVDENCHLVVTSRTLLSLPDLPLMIGRSQVKGLSFEELAFEPEEIRELYQLRYQQELSGRDAEEIAQETDGWITGLLLTAETSRQGLTEHGRAARAAGVDLYDYLAAQVLEQQTPEMRDFLLRTSLLEEFNQELCQLALGEPMGEQSWAELIKELQQANLFIQPVDNGGTWLRYQHLFQEFLQQHYRIIDPEGTDKILRSLISVYRQKGWWEKAYAACQKLGDEEIQLDYIESVSSLLVHGGRILLLKSWIDGISLDSLEKRPRLLIDKGG